jgi:O-antigen/teichoic acid export membrane protein
MQSLKKNALYNTAYQIIRLIFPLITFPYVSRVLGPEGIGKVSYAQTIAEYFTVFSLLGIPIYAVREASRCRAVPGQINKTFSEVVALSFILSSVSLALYSAFLFLFPGIAAEPSLHWVFAFTLLFNWAQIDWFYQGIENYRYITVRNLFIRIFSIMLIFLVVKEKDHYLRYGAIWAAGTVLSCLLNLSYSLRLVKFSLKNLNLKTHLLKSLPSALMVSTGMLYKTINVILLGVLINDDKFSLGIFNAAGRLVRIAMSIIIALSAVLAPRISYMFEIGEERKLLQIIKKSLSITLYLAIPATIGLMIAADDLILLFAGSKFRPAVLTMRIVAPELVIVSISTIIGQLLYGCRQEKKILIITLISMFLAGAANFILIPRFKQDGAAAATIAVRLVETILYIIFSRALLRNVFTFELYKKILLVNILFAALLPILKTGLGMFSLVYRLPLFIVGGIVIYTVLSSLFRPEPYQNLKDWAMKIPGKIMKRFR